MGRRKEILKQMKRNWLLYLFLLPGFVYIAVFHYVPIYGIQIAFKNYRYAKGIFGSDWVGLKWFRTFLNAPSFWKLLKNTLTISLYSLVVDFPLPIVLGLILNDVENLKLKKFAQTITYMPHFISTVVLVGMISIFFSPNSGIVNTLLSYLGGSGNVYFMGDASCFPHLYVWSGVWQGMGWSSVIYFAALSGISPELHEAAKCDGATKFQLIRYIDLPSILPTATILLIMNCGSILSIGFEKAYALQNDLNLSVSEIISTYVYKVGLIDNNMSYSSAIGLFNTLVNMVMLIIVNTVSDKLSGNSLF